MQNDYILHLMVMDKFLPPFIDFISENFNITKHKFVFLGTEEYNNGLTKKHPVEWIDLNQGSEVFKLLIYLDSAKKIILHGLWSEPLLILLNRVPRFLPKCYWVMWGGDFYFPEKQSWIRKEIIKKISHFVTYVKGDYKLVKQWYGAKGEYHKCFMYPSNLYKEYNLNSKIGNTINIQIGNSADPTNNHLEIFKKLLKNGQENILIFAPLSYGNQNYAKEVIKIGKTYFGDKFIPLTEFVPFEKYLAYLSTIDIAIFAHKRQQGMGNIITLLGLGKKVYLRSDVTTWQLFKELGVKVFDVENIDIEPLDEQTKKENQMRIAEHFSVENLKKQLEQIFFGG